MKLIVMKKGGQPGKVAINPALVTEVRSAAGPFTDIYFGPHFVAVQGSFEQVVAILCEEEDTTPDPSSQWLKQGAGSSLPR